MRRKQKLASMYHFHSPMQAYGLLHVDELDHKSMGFLARNKTIDFDCIPNSPGWIPWFVKQCAVIFLLHMR